MHVTLVHVIVKAEYIDKFIEACRLNHQASIQESGNFRFDILQNAETPQKFVLYESYKSVKDAAAHKNTSHYLNWRETIANWMVEPRQGVRYQGLFPRV